MGGLSFVQWVLNAKTLFIYSISDFNFGRHGALFGGLKPRKSPRGDGTECNIPTFGAVV